MRHAQNLIFGILLLALLGPASAQTAGHRRHHVKAPKVAAGAQPAPAGDTAAAKPGAGSADWSTHCASATRGAPLDCSIEQSAVLTKTGQLIVLVSIRIPAQPRLPVILSKSPLGVFLPGGVRLQVDNGNTETFALQTCEQRGCFAGGAVSADLLRALMSGQTLKVTFQDLQRQALNISLPLGDFGPAYEKIK